MDEKFQIKTIGKVNKKENGFSIDIFPKFIPALNNIEGFSHLQIVWWGHLTEEISKGGSLTFEKLYKKGPESIGVFATRSPVRPNPILVSTIKIDRIDFHKGSIHTPFIDAEDGTPILDVKPYHLMERVKECKVPGWCSHWPQCYEDSASFNWEEEIDIPS